jgi:hypothetical protein
MAKDTFYFSHDFNARNDIKIKKLIAKHGYLGYGLFWAIIEELYNNTNVLPNDYECIAFDLRTDANVIKSIVNDFDLFEIDNESFGSLSIERRLNERNEKSKKARESVLKRWNKSKEDTNVLQTYNDSNTIKERKGKENKEKKINNIDSRKLKFAATLQPFLITYGKDFLNDFYKYWTEPNKSNTKFKQELEKTWSLSRRLETWAKNDNKFNKQKNGTTKITDTIEFKQLVEGIKSTGERI